MSKIYVDEILPKDNAATHIPGSIVQVQYAVTTTPVTVSPNVNTDVLDLAFTPKFSTSKLLIQVNTVNMQKASGAGANTWGMLRVKKDGGYISNFSAGAIGYPETFSDHRYNEHILGFVDSYSGTSTFTVTAGSASTGSNWTICYQDNPTYIIIQEIAQ